MLSDEKFLSNISKLTQQYSDNINYISEPKIGLAISGGPDSLALLLLMHHHYKGKFCAATVDHGLRSASRDEADYVASLCRKMQIKHETLRPQKHITGNIQSQARKARYALLQQWAFQQKCNYIATAHHADDQLETMIMRINRGSGVAGLAGIRECNHNIIRPLLSYRKSDLIAICTQYNVQPIHDPSNNNDSFDRVKVRQWLKNSESITEKPLFDPVMAHRTATYMNDAENALQFTSHILAQERIKPSNGKVTVDITGLPDEYQRRLLLNGLEKMPQPLKLRASALGNIIKSLKKNEIFMVSNIKCSPVKSIENSNQEIWQLSNAPPRRHK